MEIKDLTAAQLASENPQLMASIREAAMQAERERMQDIDDLTTPGYEQMAAEAKKSGMSAMDFHKTVVKAQREKGTQFMQSRKGEVSQSAGVWRSERRARKRTGRNGRLRQRNGRLREESGRRHGHVLSERSDRHESL